ncbi:hypothetical protein EA770_10440 [Acinetobacter baumannii]|nr:hypothetical protein EA770_10440 [Acinetobacter baumannii]
MEWLKEKMESLGEVFDQFPSVLIIVLFTICMAIFSPFVYVSILTGIADTQILTAFPFKSLIEDNIDILKYGLVLVPFAVICIGFSLAHERYSRILSRFY